MTEEATAEIVKMVDETDEAEVKITPSVNELDEEEGKSSWEEKTFCEASNSESKKDSFEKGELSCEEDDLTETFDVPNNDKSVQSSKSFLESLDLEVPSSYEVEPVDFPKSPWFSIKNESQNIVTDNGEEDKSMFQAENLSNCQDINLSKDDIVNSSKKKKVIPVTSDIFTDTNFEESSFDGSHTSIDEAEFDAYLDSPDELDDSIMERLGNEIVDVEPIPELSAEEERSESLCWKSCVIAGIERRIDLKVLEPYKKVISHGGYLSQDSHHAIIVFSACFLPDRSRSDYDYVMNNLFMYVITTLDQLVTDDYILIYLHGATPRSCMPKFKWLKLCYQMIDRKLKKNLKGLYMVHPTFWLKTLVLMTRPFISSKFSRKLFFIHSLSELFKIIPLDESLIPDRVKKYNELKEFLEKE